MSMNEFLTNFQVVLALAIVLCFWGLIALNVWQRVSKHLSDRAQLRNIDAYLRDKNFRKKFIEESTFPIYEAPRPSRPDGKL